MKYVLEKEEISLFPYADDFIRMLRGALGIGKVEDTSLRIVTRFTPYVLEEYNLKDEAVISPLGSIIVFTKGLYGEKRIQISEFCLQRNSLTFNILMFLNHKEESIEWPYYGIDTKEIVLENLKRVYARYYKFMGVLIECISRVVYFIFNKQFLINIRTYGKLEIAFEYVGLENYNDVKGIERELKELFSSILRKTKLKKID